MAHLSDLQDFALGQENSELLECITKSKDIVVRTICDTRINMKQTKHTDYLHPLQFSIVNTDFLLIVNVNQMNCGIY